MAKRHRYTKKIKSSKKLQVETVTHTLFVGFQTKSAGLFTQLYQHKIRSFSWPSTRKFSNSLALSTMQSLSRDLLSYAYRAGLIFLALWSRTPSHQMPTSTSFASQVHSSNRISRCNKSWERVQDVVTTGGCRLSFLVGIPFLETQKLGIDSLP